MNESISENTPVCMVTVGQLMDYATKHKQEAADKDTGRRIQQVVGPESKYIYGLKSICQRYGVGKNTACNWASGLLAPAVLRDGRKIFIDVEKADKLLEQWTQEQRQRKAVR